MNTRHYFRTRQTLDRSPKTNGADEVCEFMIRRKSSALNLFVEVSTFRSESEKRRRAHPVCRTAGDAHARQCSRSVASSESQKLEGHKNLTSIKGIGRLSAGILLSIIGNINDFADEGRLAAYFGIVPRISNSNETEHSGRITKRGTKLGRTTLVQCALIAQRYSPYLKNYYERKKSRGTGKAIPNHFWNTLHGS
jgi:transposase